MNASKRGRDSAGQERATRRTPCNRSVAGLLPQLFFYFAIFAFFAVSLIPELFAAELTQVIDAGPSENLVLPPPFATKPTANSSQVIGWPKGKTPLAPAGFEVNLFAEDLDNPRTLHVLANGDVLVMESSRRRGPSRIILLRDGAKSGSASRREIFLSDLNAAFGMALHADRFYVGNTDGIGVYPFRAGETQISTKPERILNLPAGGHYTRNVAVDAEGKKLYVAVGSATNVDEERIDEKDPRRAAILQANLDGSGMRVFASGLRNPVGLDREPATNSLWTVVNERDGLGDDLVPDYLTRVRDGAFYGWPYSYFGQNEDPRKKGQRPDLVAKAIKPDYALGSHVAPLGLAFYQGKSFPQRYHGGAFIGLHGSWNRSSLVGYNVAFVPFRGGKPSGAMEHFLTGFLPDAGTNQVHGRPVGVAVWTDGSLLVSDDGAGKIWRVSVKK